MQDVEIIDGRLWCNQAGCCMSCRELSEAERRTAARLIRGEGGTLLPEDPVSCRNCCDYKAGPGDPQCAVWIHIEAERALKKAKTALCRAKVEARRNHWAEGRICG